MRSSFSVLVIASCLILGCSSGKPALYVDRDTYTIHARKRDRITTVELYEVASRSFPNANRIQGISTYPKLFRDTVPVHFYVNSCLRNQIYRNFKAVELTTPGQSDVATKHLTDSLARVYPDRSSDQISVLGDTAMFYSFQPEAEYPSMVGEPLGALIKPEHVYELCYHKEQADGVEMWMSAYFETDRAKAIIFWTEQKTIIKAFHPTVPNL